jgi:hypothetical protein
METLPAKLAFEKLCANANCSIKHYQADNSQFFDKEFLAASNNLNQTIDFGGVGAHHKKGIFKNRNKQLTYTARVLLLHGMRMQPQMVDQMLWLFEKKTAAERMNSLHIDTDITLLSLNHTVLTLKTFWWEHFMQCSIHATFLTADSTML